MALQQIANPAPLGFLKPYPTFTVQAKTRTIKSETEKITSMSSLRQK